LQPTSPAPGTRGRLIGAAGTALLAALLVLRAWRLHVQPLDLPSGDAGYYALQALRYRELLLDGQLGAAFSRMTLPELHPFLHPLLLGLWSGVVGVSQAAMRSYGAVVTLLALATLPWLGRLAAPRGGEGAGLLVILLCLLGSYQPAHLFTCMTEPTSLLACMLALVVALRTRLDPRPWVWLLLGAAVTLAGLVRYSNLPLLLTPLLLADLVTAPRAPWQIRLARWACWVAPSLLVGACWFAVEPELGRALGVFMVNATSSEAAAGLAGWLWVPWAISTRYAGSWLLAGPMLLLFASGLLALLARQGRELPLVLGPVRLVLRLASSPGLVLLQLTVLVGLLALSVHPVKVTRNLSGLVPLLYLCALLPWIRSSVHLGRARRRLAPWSRPLLAAAVLSLYCVLPSPDDPPGPTQGGGLGQQLRALGNDHPDHHAQPAVQAMLEALEPAARESRWLLVQGWGFADALLVLWAADLGLAVEIIQSWDPSRLAPLPAAQAQPGELATFVLVSPPFPPGKEGETDRTHETATALAAAGVPPLDHIETSHHWRLRLYQQRRSQVDELRIIPTREDIIARELDVGR